MNKEEKNNIFSEMIKALMPLAQTQSKLNESISNEEASNNTVVIMRGWMLKNGTKFLSVWNDAENIHLKINIRKAACHSKDFKKFFHDLELVIYTKPHATEVFSIEPGLFELLKSLDNN
jgi:hypothetical protein